MIPVMQTKVVVKNSNDEEVVRGNCLAAVIASFLELPITEIPNVEVLFYINGNYWQQVLDTFLNAHGWEWMNDDRFRCFHPEVEFHENNFHYCNELKDKYYIVTGQSIRGISHCCIYQNGELVHDPHPTKEGLITVKYFESLSKIGSYE